MSFLSRLSCIAVLLVVADMVQAAAPPYRETVLEEFDFSMHGGLIIVPLTIDGKSYPFLVDTGATISCFDESLKRYLGEPVSRRTGKRLRRTARHNFYKPPAAQVGSLPLSRKGTVLVHSVFREIRERHGVQVWGYLGMDFLADYVVRIDFDTSRIALLRSATGAIDHRVLLTSIDGIPLVEVQIAHEKDSRWFKVDTGKCGYGSGILSGETYRLLEEAGKLKKAGLTMSLTARGNSQTNVGRLDSLKIGPFQHDGLFFTEGIDRGILTLGLEFWSRYRVTFDFPGGVAYLQKGSRHDVADLVDGSGLTIRLRDGHAMVEIVTPNSPAAKAGIRKGDEVVSIAGRQAAGANLYVLRKLLCGEWRIVKLVLRRGNKKREVPLHLEVAGRTDETMR